MKKNYIITTRPHNALLVFRYECIPDKTVWVEEKYIGAEVHCFLDRNIKNTHELSEAEMDSRDFLARSGWIVKELFEDPLWLKMPCRFRCLFSKVLKARRTAMEIAQLDGISLIAYSWEVDDTEPEAPSRPWYMRKIVLPVLCVLAVAIPNLLNYCDVDGFSNHSGYFGFGCLDSLFYAVGIEWQNMVFISVICLLLVIAVYTPIEIYYWIVKEDISLTEENK